MYVKEKYLKSVHIDSYNRSKIQIFHNQQARETPFSGPESHLLLTNKDIQGEVLNNNRPFQQEIQHVNYYDNNA